MNATQTESMRQNRDKSTMPSGADASTCGFFTQKRRRAQASQNLPHTSVGQFRKCGENPKSTDQSPVLTFRDLRFCCQKSGCARRFPIFSPHFRNNDSASRVLVTKAASATTSSSHGNVKGPLPETEQRPFFVSASRRIRGDCITEIILQQRQAPGIPEDVPSILRTDT